MKRFVAFVLLIAAILALPLIVVAQEPRSTYKVKQGDTVWGLSGQFLHDPFKWGQVVGMNPFLRQPNRQFILPDGRLVVVIKPGETLVGIGQISGEAPVPIPVQQIVTQGALPLPLAAPSMITTNNYFFGFVPPWLFWLVVGAVLIAGGYAIWRIFQNPGTSGTPVVRGGIDPSASTNIESRAQQIADHHYMASSSTATITPDNRPVRIGEIEYGTLSGFGRVQYDGGRIEMRRLNNEPAYRAQFRFPGGREEHLQFLQICGNDVTIANMRYLDFTFNRQRPVVPATAPPAPEPVREPTPLRPVATAPATQTTMVVAGEREFIVPIGTQVRVEDGQVRLVVPTACTVIIRTVARVKRTKPRAVRTSAASGE